MPSAEVRYYDVILMWKSRSSKASPFVTVKIECMPARDKEDAKKRALSFFALSGTMMDVKEVIEL